MAAFVGHAFDFILSASCNQPQMTGVRGMYLTGIYTKEADIMSVFLPLLDIELVPVPQNPSHKGSGFFIGRDPPPVSSYGVLPSIICRQSQGHIVVEIV